MIQLFYRTRDILDRRAGDAKDAGIAADIAEGSLETPTDAGAVPSFESASDADHLGIDYWILEQPRLGRFLEKSLVGCVAVVTGGDGAFGHTRSSPSAGSPLEVAVPDYFESRVQVASC